MQVVLNKKSTKEITLYSVGLYLSMSGFLFQFYLNTGNVYFY